MSVPMMHQEAEVRCAEIELVQLLELPYTTGDLSMVFVLPPPGYDLADVESVLAAALARLASWTSKRTPMHELAVTIPASASPRVSC